MHKRRIILIEEDAFGNSDWFLSTPYLPGDAYKGKLKRLIKYIQERKRVMHKILRQEHGWIGQITTKIIWMLDDKQVSFKEFYLK